jgi:hypothetical protein
MKGGAVGHNFERGPPKHPPIQIWFILIYINGLTGEDSNMMFYQNMSNLHNRNKSA